MAYVVKESNTYYKPVVAGQAASVPAGGSGTVTISVPAGRRYYIKQVIITNGANTTIDTNGVMVDGAPTGIRETHTDLAAYFGFTLSADREISLTGANAGTAAEDLMLKVIGVEVEAV